MYLTGQWAQTAISRRSARVSAGASSSVTSATPALAASARSSSAPLHAFESHSALPGAGAAAAAVQLLGQVVCHEPAVAAAHHVHRAVGAEAREVAAAAVEERGEGGGLEGVGAVECARGGGAEEEQRGHHQVEVQG